MGKNEKYVPGVCEKDFCARSKNAIIRKSLSGEAHKQILQKSARDSHHRMNCGSGVIWVMRKCVSGEWNKHICDFVHFHEIRICYVYHGHSDTCDSRFKNCSGFIVFLAENRAATRGFYHHYLENGRENHKNNIRAWYFEDCLFCLQNKLQIATREQDLVIHAPLQTSTYWLFHWFYSQLPRGTKTDDFECVLANAWIWRRRAAARTWTFWGRFIVKTRRTYIGTVLLERLPAHLELRFPMILGFRTLKYRFL